MSTVLSLFATAVVVLIYVAVVLAVVLLVLLEARWVVRLVAWLGGSIRTDEKPSTNLDRKLDERGDS